MTIQRTLSIIKPDATGRGVTGAINAQIEKVGLKIVAQKRLWLTCAQAEAFYYVHQERSFFKSLCVFMSSGPVVAQVLEGENGVQKNRDLMGATNPLNAAEGTLRRDFGVSIELNAVHGSDSLESAAEEIPFFFSKLEIVG